MRVNSRRADPAHPSTVGVVVGDDLGELRAEASSPRQRFLEAFRLRSEHASAITDTMRAQMATRLVEEYGSSGAAADAVWALARENGWYREGKAAERYFLVRPDAEKVSRNKAALDFIVAWHGTPLGHLIHDCFEWRWRSTKRASPPIIREKAPGRLPGPPPPDLPPGMCGLWVIDGGRAAGQDDAKGVERNSRSRSGEG